MRVLVLAINYANEEEVIEYAKTISRQSISKELGLVVVNNKSSIGSKLDLLSDLNKIDLDIRLYEPGENLGYLNGVFYGYNQFMQSNPETNIEWVIISNTDIIINDIAFFEKMLDAKYEEDIWCVAPSAYSNSTKSYQNPHYINRLSKEKLNRVIMINSLPILAFIYNALSKIKSKYKNKDKKAGRYVYSPHGCFFCLRSEFMEILKDNHYKGFLYSEESYIAEHLLINHKKCYYDSNIEVLHTENSVTGYLGTKKRAEYIKNSLKYIRDEFY